MNYGECKGKSEFGGKILFVTRDVRNRGQLIGRERKFIGEPCFHGLCHLAWHLCPHGFRHDAQILMDRLKLIPAQDVAGFHAAAVVIRPRPGLQDGLMLILGLFQPFTCPDTLFPGWRRRVPMDRFDLLPRKLLSVIGKASLAIFGAVNLPPFVVDRRAPADIVQGLLGFQHAAFGFDERLLDRAVDRKKLFLDLAAKFQILAPRPFSNCFM